MDQFYRLGTGNGTRDHLHLDFCLWHRAAESLSEVLAELHCVCCQAFAGRAGGRFNAAPSLCNVPCEALVVCKWLKCPAACSSHVDCSKDPLV